MANLSKLSKENFKRVLTVMGELFKKMMQTTKEAKPSKNLDVLKPKNFENKTPIIWVCSRVW